MEARDLGRPVREVAARCALRQLRSCLRRAALGPKPDPDALHDFRVAVRRLRTWLREFHEPLGLPRRDEPLRRAARLTGAARDRQVLRELRSEAALKGGGRARGEAAALRKDWERARAGAAGAVLELSRLAAQLASGDGGAGGKAFGAFASRRVLKRLEALERRLSKLGSRADGPKAHRVRIAGKRLRYLLEPLPGSAALVRELKEAQDRLGRARDLSLLGTRADGADGARLSAWARREAREEGSRHRRAMSGKRGRTFFRGVQRFAVGLASRPARRG